MFKTLCALGFSLLPLSVSAFTGPVSDLEIYDCIVVEKCDLQNLCAQTNEETELIFSTVVQMAPLSPENYADPNGRIKGVEKIAWIDLPSYPNKRFPLPIWYRYNFEVGEPKEFRLEDWLSGKQVSPYDEQFYAFVFEANVGSEQELWDLWEERDFWFKLYEKEDSTASRFETIKIICPEYGK